MIQWQNADYTTLADVKARLGITEASEDALIAGFISQASARISAYARRVFVPYRGTLTLDAVPPGWIGRVVFLEEDVLQADEIKVGGEIVTDYVLRPTREAPRALLIFGQNASLQYSDPLGAGQIIGTFGYHSDYSRAWRSVDTLTAGVTSSGTVLSVNSVSALDERGLRRFTRGDYVRVGSEFMRVLSVNTSVNQMTVDRGIRGTTAAAHSSGAAVSVYRQMEDVKAAAEMLAVYLYQNKNAVQDVVQVVGQALTIHADAVARSLQMISPYVRSYWGAVV